MRTSSQHLSRTQHAHDMLVGRTVTLTGTVDNSHFAGETSSAFTENVRDVDTWWSSLPLWLGYSLSRHRNAWTGLQTVPSCPITFRFLLLDVTASCEPMNVSKVSRQLLRRLAFQRRPGRITRRMKPDIGGRCGRCGRCGFSTDPPLPLPRWVPFLVDLSWLYLSSLSLADWVPSWNLGPPSTVLDV